MKREKALNTVASAILTLEAFRLGKERLVKDSLDNEINQLYDLYEDLSANENSNEREEK